jgi:hypothetical protein
VKTLAFWIVKNAYVSTSNPFYYPHREFPRLSMGNSNSCPVYECSPGINDFPGSSQRGGEKKASSNLK